MIRSAKTFTSCLVTICVLGVPLQLCRGSNETGPVNGSNREGHTREEKKQATPDEESAMWFLRSLIDQAHSPEEIQAQAAIISGAATLIWRRDEDYARESFKRVIDVLIQDYESTISDAKLSARDRARLKPLSAGISILIKGLGRRDAPLALSMLKRFQGVRTTALGDSVGAKTQNEKLEVIREGIEADPGESAALAAKLLSSGVPSSFPQFLYDLRARDAQAADNLYRIAVSLISSGAPYTSNSVNILGAYPFRERAVIVPAVGPGSDNAKSVSIGIMTSALSPPLGDPDLGLAREYVSAAALYLSRTANAGITTPSSLAQSFYLAAKVSCYVNRLGLGDRAAWNGLRSTLEVMTRNTGVDDSNLKYLAGYAERVANDQVAFLFDNGASLFEKARQTSDLTERTDLLARGVKEMIQSGSLGDAEKKILGIEDDTVKVQLFDYLNIKVGEALIDVKDWPGVTNRADKISNPNLRALLLLECARAVSKNLKGRGNRQLAVRLWSKTVEALSKVTDQNVRASGLLVVASAIGPLDADWSIRVLGDAIDEINKAKDYEGGEVRVNLSIVSIRLTLALADSDLETSFQGIARKNWLGTIALVEHVSPKLLRYRAQLGACRAVLS